MSSRTNIYEADYGGWVCNGEHHSNYTETEEERRQNEKAQNIEFMIEGTFALLMLYLLRDCFPFNLFWMMMEAGGIMFLIIIGSIIHVLHIAIYVVPILIVLYTIYANIKKYIKVKDLKPKAEL